MYFSETDICRAARTHNDEEFLAVGRALRVLIKAKTRVRSLTAGEYGIPTEDCAAIEETKP